MTENTLTQEQRRHCTAGVAYRAFFSSTAHGVMWVFLWLYRVMYSMYITYLTQHLPRLTLTTLWTCVWHTIIILLNCVLKQFGPKIVHMITSVKPWLSSHYDVMEVRAPWHEPS